jgi:hypothetical protein
MRGTALECIQWLASQEPTKRFEVSEETSKKKRSLTQNAYY